jgi:small multidrug resistance family-3 protein
VERLLIIGGLFVLAGLCEIGGGYLVWGWMRDHKPLLWALLGVAVYAAYGGVFIALALLWGVLVDGFQPDRWDLLGAVICVVGGVVMVAPSRG